MTEQSFRVKAPDPDEEHGTDIGLVVWYPFRRTWEVLAHRAPQSIKLR
jgi:hypothetical protein